MTPAWHRGPLVGLLLALLGALGAHAQSGAPSETLVVARVPIEAQGPDGTRAKERALADGRQAAFQRLLQRMVLPEDQRRLGPMSAAEVGRLVASFGLDEERAGADRYRALLTVAFAGEGVRRLLRERGVPYALTAARPAVVLPLLQAAGTESLWEEPNPWRDAWAAQGNLDGLVPLIVPLGDVGDVAAISAAAARAADPAALKRIAQRYRVEHVVLAEATLADADVRLRLLPMTEWGMSLVEVREQAPAGEDPAVLYPRLQAELVARLEDDWKRANLVRGDARHSLEATVILEGLADWTRLRARLAAQPLIERIEVQSVARDRARIVLHHAGETAQLAAALAQENLALTADGPSWRLGPALGAERRAP